MNRDFMMMLGNMFGRKDNQGFSQSSMQELAQRLQTEKDFILLDVRTHEEFNEGHIPGAICIPNEIIASQAASQLPNKEQLIFVYCHSGMRSMMSANFWQAKGTPMWWSAAGLWIGTGTWNSFYNTYGGKMKKIIYLLASAVLFISCSKGQFTQISMEELAHRIQTESDYILLDVRTPEEFSTGHIPGAICIPNESIGKQEIPTLPNKKQRIYIYCRSGNRSKHAADKLLDLGYTNLVEAGGIMNWQGEIEVGR